MSDNTIPEYLQPALAQLEKARAAHLENARLMDETVTAIGRALSAWHAGSWYRNMTIWPWC